MATTNISLYNHGSFIHRSLLEKAEQLGSFRRTDSAGPLMQDNPGYRARLQYSTRRTGRDAYLISLSVYCRSSGPSPAVRRRCAGSVKCRSNPGRICRVQIQPKKHVWYIRPCRLCGSHTATCARSYSNSTLFDLKDLDHEKGVICR